MSKLDALIVGVPKAGTTWLANVLSQNPKIILSEPKEPNVIASHKGTFGRDTMNPDWSKYDDYFNGRVNTTPANVINNPSPRKIFPAMCIRRLHVLDGIN